MVEERAEGIVLQNIPFQDSDRIITVYTKQAGLISLIVKKITSHKINLLSTTSPLCIAEFIYNRGKSQIFLLIDSTIIDENLSLRQDLSHLKAAGEIVKSILESQLPQKKTPLLYLLLKTYIKNIPPFSNLTTLTSSFKLKILLLDGLLNLKDRCSFCSKEAYALEKGAAVCPYHASDFTFHFTPLEYQTLKKLALVKRFSSLKKINLPFSLQEKIGLMFKHLIHD